MPRYRIAYEELIEYSMIVDAEDGDDAQRLLEKQIIDRISSPPDIAFEISHSDRTVTEVAK